MPEVADAFAQVGIAGLCFDYQNFGDSEGLPREEVSHYGRLEDWQNDISYATGLEEIGSEHIGVWGTGLGGRDVPAVASIDRRVKAVLTQTPVMKWFLREYRDLHVCGLELICIPLIRKGCS